MGFKTQIEFFVEQQNPKSCFFLLWDQVDKLLLPNLIFIRIIQLSLSHTEGKFNEAFQTCNFITGFYNEQFISCLKGE